MRLAGGGQGRFQRHRPKVANRQVTHVDIPAEKDYWAVNCNKQARDYETLSSRAPLFWSSQTRRKLPWMPEGLTKAFRRAAGNWTVCPSRQRPTTSRTRPW